MSTRHILLLAVNAVLLLCLFLLQLLLGSFHIPLTEVVQILLGGNNASGEVGRTIVMESRLPGALAAAIAGAGLAISGLQMQTMFRNPVAGPFVLGISSGAGLGVAVLILASSALGINLQQSWVADSGIVLFAAAGAFLIFLLNVFISYRLNDVVAILIIGLMIGSGISAFIEVLQSFAAGAALKNYVIWTFGSFRYVNAHQVWWLAGLVAIASVLSWFLSKPLNLLLLGDTYAQSSGLEVKRAKLGIVLCTSLLAGSVTAFCGPIGFVGLAVPHIARALFNTADHRLLTPAGALIGAVICSACNLLATLPGTEFNLPVNAVTSLIGAPFVIWIILKQKGRA
ncbi:MAG: iron ABC transporter permease [Chitinophagales bacterium]